MNPVICIPFYEAKSIDVYRKKAYQKIKEYYSKLSFPIFSGNTSINYSNRAKSRNQAVKMIDCDYNMILFFDADIIVPFDQVQAAIDLAYQTNEMVLMFDFLYLLTEKVTNDFYKDDVIQNKYGIHRKNPSSGAFVVPRNIWERVGGQDERFKKWGGEDRAFYFACAAVHNKRVIQRIPGKAWHLFHRANKHTLHDLRNNLLLQKYLRAVKACPRFTVPNETLEDNSEIFSILKEKDGPLYVGSKETIISENNIKFQNMVTFVSTTGYKECVEKDSSTYKILKCDPSFKEIVVPTVSTSLCVLNFAQTIDRTIFLFTQKWINKNFSSIYSPNKYKVVLAYNIGESIFEFKKRYPNQKVIMYQLEQLYNQGSQWFNLKSNQSTIKSRTKHIQEWLNNADEIWEYDLDNKDFLESLGYKVKYVPLYPDQSLCYSFIHPKKIYDLVFYGSLNAKRYNWLKQFDKKYKLLFIGNPGKFFLKNIINDKLVEEKLFEKVRQAKIALNLHYYDTGLQEQIRIFELLSNDILVISEKSRRNYLKIPEFETFDQACVLIDQLLNKKYELKIGLAYSTFYGLEHLQEILPKIRSKVDYIVIVHQKISFQNNPESMQNSKILKEFQEKNLIDDLIYYDNVQGSMVEKRNIGLNYCRKNNCDWIIPLDADEEYDYDSLIEEIHKADKDNIQTLYSPIQTYYYNKNYYYHDSFYVASAYKINDRAFQKCKTSCSMDLERKMQERSYRNINTPMLHYNYLLKPYKNKIKDKIGIQNHQNEIQIIYDYLKKWKPGMLAKVFQLKNGNRVMGYQELKSNIQYLNGITSEVKIEGGLVYKIIKNTITQYNVSIKEIIEREIYWLKRLEKYDISPKFIEKKENTIIMSYTGNNLTEKELQQPTIQIQFINILGVLFSEHCYYNDFKLDNFTIKNGKLFIIDFGWCPLIQEDYSCNKQINTGLSEKPNKNIFDLFENIKNSNIKDLFLTKEKYHKLANIEKEKNYKHWEDNINGDTIETREEYHLKAAEILKSIKPKKVLEAGTMGVKLYENSDTIDYDLPNSGWTLTYTPTYNHNLKNLPWPIKDNQYNIFVALRVFHHFSNSLIYFNEMLRIASYVLLALPQKNIAEYKKITNPVLEYVCSNSDTVILLFQRR